MKQKTDKIDAKKLSEYYSKDLLHVTSIPDEIDEAVRDSLRSKLFVKSTLTKVKNHILAMCRRLGINYRMETDKKSHWTTHHLAWLTGRISKLKNKITIKNFRILFKQFEDLNSSIGLYENEIEAISCEERYKDKVNTLLAFKGVKKESALTLITELGDIKRFDHPKRITSYAGFDLVEYSSGGKERKSGISKMGNSNIRKIAVSAVQYSIRSPVAGVELRRRRKNCNAKVLQIASKCDARLHKKGSRMLYAGKPIMKIQVACAREFLGFIWEALNEAA